MLTYVMSGEPLFLFDVLSQWICGLLKNPRRKAEISKGVMYGSRGWRRGMSTPPPAVVGNDTWTVFFRHNFSCIICSWFYVTRNSKYSIWYTCVFSLRYYWHVFALRLRHCVFCVLWFCVYMFLFLYVFVCASVSQNSKSKSVTAKCWDMC